MITFGKWRDKVVLQEIKQNLTGLARRTEKLSSFLVLVITESLAVQDE